MNDYDPTENARDRARERARMAPFRCTKCGSTGTDVLTGLDDETHFPGAVYRICRSCGHDQPIRPGQPGYGIAKDVRKKDPEEAKNDAGR